MTWNRNELQWCRTSGFSTDSHADAVFTKQHSNPMRHSRIRTIRDPFLSDDWLTDVFLVLGRRYYLVSHSIREICIWDLGYTSNVDCKLLASVRINGGTCSCTVHVTSDGMSLIIVGFFSSIEEIATFMSYTRKTNTSTATCSFPTQRCQQVYSLPNKVVSYASYGKGFIFTV